MASHWIDFEPLVRMGKESEECLEFETREMQDSLRHKMQRSNSAPMSKSDVRSGQKIHAENSRQKGFV